MLSASGLLMCAVGPKIPDGCVMIDEFTCWVCAGRDTHGMPRDDWNSASFTGQNRVRAPASKWVCSACVWVCARLSPVPGRPPKDGKQYGGNFRNYSHAYDGGEYANFSKGEKAGLLAWLRAPRRGLWWAAIADSGQKHVIPWAPLNPPGTRRGSVLFEEQVVTLPMQAGWALVERMTALLTAGATKDEIASGDYTSRAWQLCGDALPRFEDEWARQRRGSAWFALALWLAQRDEAAVAARMEAEKNAKAEQGTARAPRARNGRAPARPAARVSTGGSKSNEALGSTARPDASGGSLVVERPRVGDEHVEVAATRKPKQGSLFGD